MQSCAYVVDSPGHKRIRIDSDSQPAPSIRNDGLENGLGLSSARNDARDFNGSGMQPPKVQRNSVIDPALSSDGPSRADRMQDQGYKDAINAWSRFRFVRAGWFTPAEAIDYID